VTSVVGGVEFAAKQRNVRDDSGEYYSSSIETYGTLQKVKLTAKVKLQPTAEQRIWLLETMRRVNAGCDLTSEWIWENKKFGQFAVQKAVYHSLKERLSLSAQMAVLAVKKTTDAYKLDKKTKRQFRPLGAIGYDSRVLSWKLGTQTVSIWTLEGRQSIPFLCGEYQANLLLRQQGETDLAFIKGNFYLLTTVNVEQPDPIEVQGILGVDLGIVQIATDSDGNAYSGSHLNAVRHRHRNLRTKLQKKATKGAKRRLKELSGKEERFSNHTNHVISKSIVETAERTNRAISLEELTGIRSRIRAKRQQRAKLHSWAFSDLGLKIGYKAQKNGVPVYYVDPRNTSRTCPACGHVDKANRPTQAKFRCTHCDLSGNADHFAAIEIGRRALVNVPHLGEANSGSVPKSPRL
jgi:putative transposase